MPHYDIFISYASFDRTWAQALKLRLEQRGLRCFLDIHDLRPARNWKPDLDYALFKSRHMVMVWSDHAEDSEWVAEERLSFQTASRISRQSGDDTGRLLVQVNLSGGNRFERMLQAINDLKVPYAAGLGPDDVEADIWSALLTKIEAEVNSRSDEIVVYCGVLAATRPELEDARNAPVVAALPPLSEMVMDNMECDIEDVLERYGDRRTDWRPLAGDRSILTIMDDLRVRLAAAELPVRWRDVNDDLWSGDRDRQDAAVNVLTSEPAVVVIDPISIYASPIRDMLLILIPHPMNNPRALFLTLGPFAPPTYSSNLRLIINKMANALFDAAYRPPVPARASAQFGINLADDIDIERLLRRSLAVEVAGNGPPAPLGMAEA